MCDKAIPENGGTLKYVSHCYKNQEMCNEAVESYPQDFVRECYKIHKCFVKAVNTNPSTTKFVPDCFVTQEV